MAKIINPAHTAFFMLASDAVYVLVIITVCNKVSRTSADLVSHVMGRRDSVHQDWINPTGFNCAEVFASQFRSFGSEEYKRLAQVLENESKVRVDDQLSSN